MSGSAVAKEAVPSACEVPPGRPTKTKNPVRCSTKICVTKKNRGGGSQSDVFSGLLDYHNFKQGAGSCKHASGRVRKEEKT
jgi:hypothetical protein